MICDNQPLTRSIEGAWPKLVQRCFKSSWFVAAVQPPKSAANSTPAISTHPRPGSRENSKHSNHSKRTDGIHNSSLSLALRLVRSINSYAFFEMSRGVLTLFVGSFPFAMPSGEPVGRKHKSRHDAAGAPDEAWSS